MVVEITKDSLNLWPKLFFLPLTNILSGLTVLSTIRADVRELPPSYLCWVAQINLFDFIRLDDDYSKVTPGNLVVQIHNFLPKGQRRVLWRNRHWAAWSRVLEASSHHRIQVAEVSRKLSVPTPAPLSFFLGQVSCIQKEAFNVKQSQTND